MTTKIEWVKNPDNITQGKTWNPITGCLNGCTYCYARKLANGRLSSRYMANFNFAPVTDIVPRLYKHLVDAYNDPFYLRFWPDRLAEIKRMPLPWFKFRAHGIFVCDMSDLFGIGIPEYWTEQVMRVIRLAEQHRFYLLTKQPQNLAKWNFPDNCWVGVTATNQKQYNEAIRCFKDVKAEVKFLSIEPLLEHIDMTYYIGYNEPIDKEISHAGKIQRGNGISGCGAGGTRDRRIGASLESQEQVRDTLGQGSTDGNMPKATGGERYREISASQGHGELETDSLLGSQAGVEAFSRFNSRRVHYQSQERQQEGQSAKQSRISNLFGEHNTYAEGFTEGTSPTSKRGGQCDGKTNRRSSQGDKVIAEPNTHGIKDSSWSQSSGIGGEVRSITESHLGRDLRANLGLSLVIVGQCTPIRPETMPKVEWVRDIVEAADKAGMKVFLKNNLKPLFDWDDLDWAFRNGKYRQEMPE